MVSQTLQVISSVQLTDIRDGWVQTHPEQTVQMTTLHDRCRRWDDMSSLDPLCGIGTEQLK